MSTALPTLVHYFHERLRSDRVRPALHIHRDGRFQPITWDRLGRDVLRAAAVLRDLGVGPGDRVVQVSENRYEWIVSDLAIQLLRAVDVAVHAVLSGPQIAFQIADSGARVVLISTPQQAAKLDGQASMLPPGLCYASYTPYTESLGGQGVVPLGERMSYVSAAAADRVFSESQTAQPEDLVTILYTSGTTGEPKGVMLSHANLASNAATVAECFPMQRDELHLCWLPLSHIYARTCACYCWLVVGYELALSRGRECVLEDCALVRPHMLAGVPYFYDSIRRHLRDQGREEEPGAVRGLLGGRIQVCSAGGAPLPEELASYFMRQDVPVLQGYGLTESSPVITMSTPRDHKVGCVGKPIPGVEVCIADDGEVLTRGPHVMVGYWNKPEATAQVLRDGWLYTGDLGEVDSEGFLRITGRKKELIVTAGGKNVAPVLIESLLAEDPLIHQAIVVGNNRPFLAALVIPARELLRATIREANWEVGPGELLTDPRIVSLYRKRIDQRLVTLSKVEQIGRFVLLPREFSLERDELTPTLKLRRDVIERHFAAEIEAMYRA